MNEEEAESSVLRRAKATKSASAGEAELQSRTRSESEDRSQRRTLSSELEVGDVNAGTYTRVHLRVKVPSRLGETVHVSGSTFLMGQFNPNESMTLVTTPEEYPYWTTFKPLILPRGVPHQYTYALFSGGQFRSWEPIDADRVLVPEGREMTVVDEYGVCEKDMELITTGEMRERSVVYERRKVPRSRLSADSQDDQGSSMDDGESSQSSSPLSRSSSAQLGRQNKLQSRYKRYQPSSFHPAPNTTLFLVCYHLPVKLAKDQDGKWTAVWNRDSLISRSEGTIAECMNVKWVGCVTHHAKGDDLPELTPQDQEEISRILASMDCVPVFIDPEVANNHYQGYCKSKLWPMFHNVDILDIYSSVWDRSEIVLGKEELNNGKWWDSYQQVNYLLAKKVSELSTRRDTVWVHDYHLLLFPSYINNFAQDRNVQRPSMVFFLHVPFPTSDIFRELSHGQQLLEGMLGVDVVGFHSFDHARHFLNACKRCLGLPYQSRRGGNLGVDYKGRNVVITISHVGIETSLIREAVNDPEVIAQANALREKHKGKILVAGTDVCQRLSGIPLKLLAFEQFFNMCPTWKDKLVMVQHCRMAHSREQDQEYSMKEINELVDRIKNQHGIDAVDLTFSKKALCLRERVAMWLACDILLLTSVREGLNLKPVEFVFSKGAAPGSNAGVVILSEFSACCCILNGALRVNPWNIAEVVNALDHALGMSNDERMGRRARDLPYITNQPAAHWTRLVLTVLQEATENLEEDEEYTDMEYMDTEIGRSHVLRIGDHSDFKQLNILRVLQSYNASTRRVFLLDYGGTIIGRENMSMYVKKDFTAVTGKVPSKRMLQALAKLCSDPRNTVFVVSGVTQSSLTHAVGHIEGLGLAAENGVLYSWPKRADGKLPTGAGKTRKLDERQWHEHSFNFDWKPVRDLVDPIFRMYCTRTNGSVLRYLQQGIAWNFRSTDPEWGLMQANSLQNDLEEVLRDFPVSIVRKKGLLEVVPEGLNKGVIVRHILTKDAAMHGGHPDFLFCIGDDTTDESMFKTIYDYYAERSEESVHGKNLTPAKTAMAAMAAMDLASPHTEGTLHHLFTCTVGKKPSNAHLYVNGVEDVEDLIDTLGDASITEDELIVA